MTDAPSRIDPRVEQLPGDPPDKAWADGVKAWWRRKYGHDPLVAWGKTTVYRLPSGKEVLGDTVARCKRWKAMGAVKVG
jgi:hypothetical protein